MQRQLVRLFDANEVAERLAERQTSNTAHRNAEPDYANSPRTWVYGPKMPPEEKKLEPSDEAEQWMDKATAFDKCDLEVL